MVSVYKKYFMKKSLLLFLVLFIQLLQAGVTVSIGEKSPEVEFKSILNYKNSSSKLSDLKSKVVIIDFWATWCSSCIEGFPRLDSLQRKFKNEIQVLTVTDETEPRIKRYLSNHKMSLPIVIDTSRAINDSFPHKVIPHTILIDKTGVIRAITTPENLNEKLISDLIAGKSIDLAVKEDKQKINPEKAFTIDNDVRFLTMVKPYNDDINEVFSSHGLEPFYFRSVFAANKTINFLFESAYEFPRKSRTILKVKDSTKFDIVPSNRFCFVLVVPEKDGPDRLRIMQQQLEQAFPYKAQIVENKMPVKILKVINKNKVNLTQKKDTTEVSMKIVTGEGLQLINSKIDGIAAFAESRLNIPVLNETGLTGRYDLNFVLYEDENLYLNDELRKLGLELVDAQRTIKTLVISDK